ncbi:MAG: hypothetical protein D6813_02825 [Calditrichaeota bacterium]|nr:MAG: hypothetical protein D6813_02825 [Calditrichota bacterium]
MLKTAGGQTITVTDGAAGVSETSDAITVNAASLSDFTLNAGTTQTAGVGFTLSVSGAVDAFGNAWSGTVVVSVSSGGGNSPNGSAPSLSDITVSAGSGSATQVLVNAVGTVLQGVADGVTRQTGTITVNPGALGSFVMSGVPMSVTAGQSFPSPANDVTVTAKDIFGNTKTDYTGTISWTSSDPNASLPSNFTFNLADNGTHAFSGNQFILKTAGTQFITVNDANANISKNSDNITVNPAALDHFTMTGFPTAVTAGNNFGANNVTVTAFDAFNNIKTNYLGTVTWSSTDPIAVLPNPYTFTGVDAGVHVFAGTQFTLNTVGVHTITVQDGAVNVSSSDITVTAGNIASFTLTPSATTVTAGTSFTLTVTDAQDINGNPVSGTVTLSFLDGGNHAAPNGTLPSLPSINVVNGTGSVPVTLFKAEAGVQIKGISGTATATTSAITVLPAGLASFKLELAVPGAKTAGASFQINGTALDVYENVQDDFNGVASLSDLTSTISPTTMTFTSGLAAANVKITLARTNNTITVNFNNKTGITAPFDVVPAALHHFTFDPISTPQIAGVPFPITVTAQDTFNNVIDSFNQTVTLSDETGTLTPTTSDPFVNGILTQNVKITKAISTKITATSGNVTGTSNLFTVKPGALHRLIIRDAPGGLGSEVGDVALTLNDKLTLYAAGYDSMNNFIRDVVATWDTTGPNGSPSTLDLPSPLIGTSTVFDPVTPNTSGKIKADTTGVIGDTTGTIVVGSIAKIVIRNAPGGQGLEVGNFQLTADDSLTLYAAGYDAGNNFVGDVPVKWSSSGTLQPVISDSSVSVKFLPTLAPASGKIFAVHPTADDDSTGIITVIPGVPVGNVQLTATPQSLPADGTSTSQIVSEVILDSDSNPVGQNRLFTVGIVPDNLGSITTPDADPQLNGHQIATNAESKLNFQFKAGTLGGTAVISVSSVNGSATGNTSIAIGSMSIISIETDPVTVSQGQTGILVNMVVRNISASTINNLSASLTFTGTVNRTGEYTQQRIDGNTSIPPQSEITLQFSVNVNINASLETITIDGEVNGQIDGTPIGAQGALQVDSWTVQKPAALIAKSVRSANGSQQDTVTVNQSNIMVTVKIANPAGAGSAIALIDSVKLKFLKDGVTDASSNFPFVADSNNPDSLAGGVEKDFNFIVLVGATAEPGDYVVDVQVFGRDANSNKLISDLSTSSPLNWHVRGAPALQILSLIPDPTPTVFAGQENNWRVRMAVQNNGNDDILINFSSQKTFIRFIIGTDVTGQYTIIYPSQLASGNNVLAAGVTDTLDFIIDKTGTTTGTATITGRVEGTDIATGNPIFDDTNDSGSGTVNIISPGETIFIQLTRAITNNSEPGFGLVNISQPFKIRVGIKNDINEPLVNVTVKLTTDGASNIEDNEITLSLVSPNTTRSIDFNVVAADSPNGVGETFTASIISATGQQSGQPAKIGVALDSTASIKIQTPASLKVSITELKQFQTVGDTFTVKARVNNLGQARVDDSGKIMLTIPSNYTLLDQTPAEQNFVQDQDVLWRVVAPLTSSTDDTFTVQITKIPIELNTQQPAVVQKDKDQKVIQTTGINLTITDLSIVAPPGARDDTLSTGQQFTLQTTLNMSKNIDRVDLLLDLSLANGYSLVPPFNDSLTIQNPKVEEIIQWRIRASSQSHINPVDIVLKARGFDNSTLAIETTDTIKVVAVNKALLNLEIFKVSNPNNATTVSIGQQFQVSALVLNIGQAAVEGPAKLLLNLGNSGFETQDELSKPFIPGQEVVWNLVVPQSISLGSKSISVKMDSIPNDENTNQTAAQGQTNRVLNLEVIDVGFIAIDTVRIISPPGATDDTLSTEQQFIVEAVIQFDRVTDVQAEIDWPPGSGFDVIGGDRFRDINSQGPKATVSWTLKAPLSNFSGDITVRATGRDISDPDKIINSQDKTLLVTVLSKANLSLSAFISGPPSAQDRILTLGQSFTITAQLLNSGEAGLAGVDSVNLTLPKGYTTKDQLTRPIFENDQVLWTIRAPQETRGIEDIVVTIISKSVDENTNLKPPLNPTQVTIPVSTEPISLIATLLTEKKPTTVIRSGKNISMFGIKFDNNSDNNITIKDLKITVQDKDGNPVAPNTVFSRIAVVDYNNPDVVYAQTSSLSDNNPLPIDFEPDLIVQPVQSLSLDFQVDILNATNHQTFELVIQSPQDDITAIDVDQNPVAIKDTLGMVLNQPLTPGFVVLTEADLQKSFFNYPNPFGYSARPVTKFNYYLPNDSEVTIRIYTLLGELVWSKTFTANSPQGQAGNHDGDIVWDGTNDKGQKVVNGAYVAVLITKNGKAMTKIAVTR